jgi:hypothetical protein
MSSWLQRLFSGSGPSTRTHGAPTSSNGASSFHLGWVMDSPPGSSIESAAVTLEVIDPPTVPRLYFWALQANFADERRRPAGGAHLGLQWHPQYPGSTAVNWGGYHDGGGELLGSSSTLGSTLGNPNTRDLRWMPRRRYRLRISKVVAAHHLTEPPPEDKFAWRGSVVDLDAGDQVVVRDLYVPGDRITAMTMWSEVFARCDDPPTAVRWSDPEVMTADQQLITPIALAVNYQSFSDGGCANTNSVKDGAGVVQRTATDRVTPQGARLDLGAHPPGPH